MEDSPGLIRTILSKMFEELIIDHAKSHPHEEVCGFVLLEDNLEIKIEPAKNESPKPRECFSISPLKFIDYKLRLPKNYQLL